MIKIRLQKIVILICVFIALYVVYELSSSEAKDLGSLVIKDSEIKPREISRLDMNDRFIEAAQKPKNKLLNYLQDENENSATKGQHIKTSNKSASPLFAGQKIVHIDLKGAPLKVSYYEEFFPLVRSLGATGLLMEYEDMFPYNNKDIPALNSYTTDEIRNIIQAAAKSNLDVIPLVQTFGHLEFVLKLESFEHLREVSKYPQVICPSRNGTRPLLTAMIDNVIALHPNIKYIHIGCDEVYNLGECSQCMDTIIKNNWTKKQLFLNHVSTIARYIKEKYPSIGVLTWDDEFRQMSVQELLSAEVGSLIEPVVWKYTPVIDPYLPDDVWDKYATVFGSVWIASAFKGATGPDKIVTDISYHLENHRSWMNLVMRFKDRVQFKGIMLTGWQRYDHFAVLCELLPVGLPSLAVNLAFISQSDLYLQSVPRSAQEVLKCGPGLLHPKMAAQCHFPGSVIYEKVYQLTVLLDQIKQMEETSEAKGWLTDYNIRTGFSSPAHVEGATAEVDRLKMELMYLEQEISQAMSEIFDTDTVKEWIYTFITPVNSKLQAMWDAKEQLLLAKTWPRRPLQIKDKVNKEL